MGPTVDALPEDLLERAVHRFDRAAVARLLAVAEDTRDEAPAQRAALLRRLAGHAQARDGAVVGVTGAPGAGKSSLLARVVGDLLTADAGLRVAVVAVDPSSQQSGGSLLGDRTRLRTDALPAPVADRLYFRSQAAADELGGLGPATFHACRVLVHLADLVLVETVGVGQAEVDIGHLADRVLLVLAPLGGDEVQMLKAGIVEVPDLFVVTKGDEPAAASTVAFLQATLGMARPFDPEPVGVLATSARTGSGIADLAGYLREVLAAPRRSMADREAHAFARWVRAEWGRRGLAFVEGHAGGAAATVAAAGGLEAAEGVFADRLRRHLCGPAG
jgi:LAO/AO transport system kinase